MLSPFYSLAYYKNQNLFPSELLWQIELADSSLPDLAHQQKIGLIKDCIKPEHSFQGQRKQHWQIVYYDV